MGCLSREVLLRMTLGGFRVVSLQSICLSIYLASVFPKQKGMNE